MKFIFWIAIIINISLKLQADTWDVVGRGLPTGDPQDLQVQFAGMSHTPESFFKFYLRFDKQDKCYDHLVSVYDMTHQLAGDLLNNYKSEAKTEQKKIFTFLDQIQNTNPECFNPVFEVHSLMAAYATTLFFPEKDIQKMQSILEYLVKNNVVKPMSADVRASVGKFKNPKIRGGYSCQQKTIWLDPKLNFMNLGLVYFHEITHFMRSVENSAHPDLYLPGLTDQQYFLLDESLSSVQMAFINKGLKEFPNRKVYQNKNAQSRFNSPAHYISVPFRRTVEFLQRPSRESFQGFSRDEVYSTKEDANLIQKKGLFANIWKKLVKTTGIEVGISFFDFLNASFENKETSVIWPAVFRKVNSIYVPEAPDLHLGTQEQILEFLKQQSHFVDPVGSGLVNIQHLKLEDIKCRVPTELPGGDGVGLDDSTLRLVNDDIKACHLGLEL